MPEDFDARYLSSMYDVSDSDSDSDDDRAVGNRLPRRDQADDFSSQMSSAGRHDARIVEITPASARGRSSQYGSSSLVVPRNRRDDRSASPADRDAYLERHGIRGAGYSGGGRPKAARYVEVNGDHPDRSNIARMAYLSPGDMTRKVAAPNAGDHSPSISSYNRIPAPPLSITGRGAKAGPGQRPISAQEVPTMQMNGPRWTRPDGSYRTALGSADHTVLTTLREMGGAGERSNHSSPQDLRDLTANSYAPYDSRGNIDYNGVTLPYVSVYSEREPSNPLVAHPVAPRIAQGAQNLWYDKEEKQHVLLQEVKPRKR